ncbi:MAG: nitroreductase family protein [Thermoleophilia bacterium]|nr:nitroreductase family protein [Thermoleophilia bacterium]
MMTPKDKWYEVIPLRHSIRAYTGEPVPGELLEQLGRVAAGFSGPAARVVVTTEAVSQVFRGVAGSYGSIVDPPAYAAVIGNKADPTFQLMCGYAGEAVVLEAVSHGLGTCWVGGFFHPDVVANAMTLAPEEQVLAVIALGMDAQAANFSHRLIKKFARSHKRKSLDELVSGLPQTEWPAWMGAALECARLAPSAVNRQPWRFLAEPGQITVSVDSLSDTYRIAKRLDCGIAMLHLETGARHLGVEGSWTYLDPPDVARYELTTK